MAYLRRSDHMSWLIYHYYYYYYHYYKCIYIRQISSEPQMRVAAITDWTSVFSVSGEKHSRSFAILLGGCSTSWFQNGERLRPAVDEWRHLEINTSTDGQPVQVAKYGRDMVALFGLRDKSRCRILNGLVIRRLVTPSRLQYAVVDWHWISACWSDQLDKGRHTADCSALHGPCAGIFTILVRIISICKHYIGMLQKCRGDRSTTHRWSADAEIHLVLRSRIVYCWRSSASGGLWLWIIAYIPKTVHYIYIYIYTFSIIATTLPLGRR